MGRVRLAWTIFKLKVTRRILAVFLRIHIWYELRNQRKVQHSYKTGQRTRKEVREAVRKVNQDPKNSKTSKVKAGLSLTQSVKDKEMSCFWIHNWSVWSNLVTKRYAYEIGGKAIQGVEHHQTRTCVNCNLVQKREL